MRCIAIHTVKEEAISETWAGHRSVDLDAFVLKQTRENACRAWLSNRGNERHPTENAKLGTPPSISTRVCQTDTWKRVTRNRFFRTEWQRVGPIGEIGQLFKKPRFALMRQNTEKSVFNSCSHQGTNVHYGEASIYRFGCARHTHQHIKVWSDLVARDTKRPSDQESSSNLRRSEHDFGPIWVWVWVLGWGGGFDGSKKKYYTNVPKCN